MYAAHCKWVADRPAAPLEAVLKARVCYAAEGRDVDGNALAIYRGKCYLQYDASLLFNCV